MRPLANALLITILIFASPLLAQENFSLIFDGIDDHVEVPFAGNHFLFVDFTIELRVFMDGGSGGRLISQVDYVIDSLGDEAYSIYVDAAGYIHVDTMALDMPHSPHTAVLSTPLTMGQWNHVALVFDNQTYTKTIYLNGELAFQEAGVGDVAFDDKPLYFGGRKDSGGNVIDNFAGRIDEVRMWAVERTQQEIQDNMYQELTGSETGLRGLWNFNEGAGSTVADTSPFGVDGTIYGATWGDFVPVSTGTWGGVKAMYR
jgi:hypothetical protein